MSARYRQDLERAIRFDDPALGIAWPVAAGEVQLSGKDQAAPSFADAEPSGIDWA